MSNPQTVNHLRPRAQGAPSDPKGFDFASLVNALQAIGQLAPVLATIVKQVIDALKPKMLRAAGTGDNACDPKQCIDALRKAHDAYHAALTRVEANVYDEDACEALGKAICDMTCAYLCLHACHVDKQSGQQAPGQSKP